MEPLISPFSDRARTLLSIGIVSLCYLSYSIVDTITKWASAFYAPSQIIFMNNSFTFVMLAVFILSHKGMGGFSTRNLKLHLTRAFVICITAFCVVNSLPLLTMADFYGITFTSPFWALIFAALLLGEKVGWGRWLAVAAGFAGVLILAAPNFSSSGAGIAMMSVAAVTIALSAIISRRIGPGDYPPLYGFYATCLAFPLSAFFALQDFRVPPLEHMPIFLIQWVCFIIGQFCFSYGFATARDVSVLAPFHYTLILYGIILGYFVFGSIPSTTTLAGLSLIVGAGLFTVWREYRLAHPRALRDSA